MALDALVPVEEERCPQPVNGRQGSALGAPHRASPDTVVFDAGRQVCI
jgi:hypothetical protein